MAAVFLFFQLVSPQENTGFNWRYRLKPVTGERS